MLHYDLARDIADIGTNNVGSDVELGGWVEDIWQRCHFLHSVTALQIVVRIQRDKGAK